MQEYWSGLPFISLTKIKIFISHWVWGCFINKRDLVSVLQEDAGSGVDVVF